jgi:hypothetical protein
MNAPPVTPLEDRAAPMGPFEKWLKAEKAGATLCISAMCCRCMGAEPDEPAPAGYRTNIKGCTDTGCPLHARRPYK